MTGLVRMQVFNNHLRSGAESALYGGIRGSALSYDVWLTGEDSER